MIGRLIRFCLENKIIVICMVLLVLAWGVLTAPFDWDIKGVLRTPVPVDAIPDIGENQQIVFTSWDGRSPEDVENQITYPLTVSLLGIPGVKTIRSYSYFGFSSVYVIFEENIEFYWSRSRVLEKLSSLPAGTLPPQVNPSLGPDATALGQIFWYTLEGRDAQGNPTGGWDLHELRTIQDWNVRYALQSAKGVSEVASVGGFVKEYQIDVNPDSMRVHGVSMEDVFMAVKMSNVDVGARTVEINKVEYLIRGVGFVKNLEDIENSVIKDNDNVPVYVKDVANVTFGPAVRRGALDKAGAEAVGGVVVVRYGENPLEAISAVKEKIAEIAPGLPKKTLLDGTISQVTVVPFYDRTGLIYETLGTLSSALEEEILVTVIVVIVSLLHFASSFLIASLLPMAVLMSFIFMKLFGVDANIVALSGIAIAIGTMVDMGIIVCENIIRNLNDADSNESRLEVIYNAAVEVGGAVITAVSTTVVSFLPVFTMTAAEGKLFKPLAYTKTFALVSSVIVALVFIPPAAHYLFRQRKSFFGIKSFLMRGLILLCSLLSLRISVFLSFGFLVVFVYLFSAKSFKDRINNFFPYAGNYLAVLVVSFILTAHWMPLGVDKGFLRNFIFAGLVIGGVLYLFYVFEKNYEKMLRWCLDNKVKFLILPSLLVLAGAFVWSGLSKEFMPPLNEGSYLYMPTTMPHASIGEALDVLQFQDRAISNIPEVDSVVGKIGRVESSLDPAPVSMVETVINYKSEYLCDAHGKKLKFAFDKKADEFMRDADGNLIPDKGGRFFRQWREHIKKPDDIWDEIVEAAKIVGTTSAPKLQPIGARIVMLQSGMRAPMGVKVKGPSLEVIEQVGLQIEKYLKEVPSVKAEAVFADRVVGKPYLEIEIDREKIARYGIRLKTIQNVIEVAIGGKKVATSVEGRERYPIRVRYSRELRDSVEALEKVLVTGSGNAQIPLIQLAEINYVRGPQVIKSEDTFLVAYVLFDMKKGEGEVDVVLECEKYLQSKIDKGEFEIPDGVSFTFAGNYKNQVRAAAKLRLVIPLAFFIIFMILYLHFKSVSTTFLVFSGILVAWSGGFIMIWLYGQDWFMNFSIFGANIREIFDMHQINLSVAIWVGFLALFGIATDDGVVIATYLKQSFENSTLDNVKDVREAVVKGALRRIRPCLMTSATTILALVPVLTSSGRGSEVMIPMAIPSFGGMTFVLVSVFVVPVLYCMVAESKIKRK